MADLLSFDESQLGDFKLVLELDNEQLQAVCACLRKLDAVPVRPEVLFHAVTRVLPKRHDIADSFVRQLMGLNGWVRQAGVKLEEVLEITRESLKANFDWAERDVGKWQKIEPVLREILSLPIVRLAAAAIDLSYEYTNLWMGARILTDIRPIFSQDATAVEGSVVSHAFRLRYSSVEGRHELNVAMDESDILHLAEQCERALQKAKTARALMIDKAKIPTAISGESDGA